LSDTLSANEPKYDHYILA